MIIHGKNIILRTVTEDDSNYILEMRMLDHKNKYLSKVDDDLLKQKAWVKKYKEREDQGLEYYFIVENKSNEHLGLIRVYDLRPNSFCWGSWLINDNAPKSTAIESALQIYEFCFYHLGYKQSHFDVRKDNKKVIAFHLRFGAKIVNEDKHNYFFNYDETNYNKIKEKYKRYLN